MGGQHERARRLTLLLEMIRREYEKGDPVPQADILRHAQIEWGVTESKVREYLGVLLLDGSIKESIHGQTEGILGTYLIPSVKKNDVSH